MTLRCSCGGPITVQNSSYTAQRLYEFYECQTCRATGTFEVNTETNVRHMTGCVCRD